ncbi:hypothetical protein JB92DRAFT_2746179 [Gautieria morchelliformis]|nr:hypothetical protein JB92DRAFT_2746179 [Gautieria morchelliformis]
MDLNGKPFLILLGCLLQRYPSLGLQWDDAGTLTSIGAQNGSASCTNPHLRKEWRTLTDSGKEAWTSAVKCLVKHPSAANIMKDSDPPYNISGSLYDDFTYVHMKLNNDIHQTGLFLPFHRYFLWSFEQALRLHCNYSEVMPYWDWTQDARNFEHATIFDPDPRTGLGGFGHLSHDGAVLDGAFAKLPLSYPVPHTLRREYIPYPFRNLTLRLYPNTSFAAWSAFTPEEIQKSINGFQGDFKGFQSYLEGMQGAHMSVHLIMGGDLGGTCLKSASWLCGPDATWSPNEPMFWLHHGMVDKVWYDWQRAHADNFWSFEGGTVRDLDTWPRYPNGAPPGLNVRLSIIFLCFIIKHQYTSSARLRPSHGWYLGRGLHPETHLQYHIQRSPLLHLWLTLHTILDI